MILGIVGIVFGIVYIFLALFGSERISYRHNPFFLVSGAGIVALVSGIVLVVTS